MGIAGPVMAYTIPSIRETYFGYKPAERVPITYPCTSPFLCHGRVLNAIAVPQRPRRPVPPGYDD